MDTFEVNEAVLDLVVGGIWDNPASDITNQHRAAANGRDGTFGGSLMDTYIDPVGLAPPMLGAKGTPIF